MKKYIGITVMMLFMVLGIFAQVADTIIIDPEIPVPDALTDLLDYGKWFGSVGALSGLAFFLGGFANKFLKAEKKLVRQLVPIAIAVILAVGSNLIGFGYLKEALIWVAAVHGIVAGGMANGWYDLIVGQGLLSFFKKPVA